jgi:type I restriction enzyme M protein
MIDKENFKELLTVMNFTKDKNLYIKHFPLFDAYLKIDFSREEIIYPEEKGFIVNERTTCNFSSNENFVVLECVDRLLEKGYKPEHIELEPKWKVGHGASGGRADILVTDNGKKPLMIIECKTFGREFEKAWKDTMIDGDQLFSYAQQIPDTDFLCLYTSDCTNANERIFLSNIISHKDNLKILEDNKELKSFEKAKNVKERFLAWKETYQLEYTTKGIFEANIQPYIIGKDKYTIDDILPVDARNKEGKYHEFRTILRKHNVSGRENAFDVLVNLFLCKIVDETQNSQDLKFYWKGIAYDSYFDLIDRLQELYKTGMDKYLNQEIVYISNKQIDEAFWTVKQKRNATKQQIKDYFRKLKFFTNNDFGFIDVHNERLFYQNAKVLLEVVQMWQDLRLKTEHHNQFLGDMFEFFLDNGIKQSEGQFFTPMPICKFILMSLPLEKIIKDHSEQPKSIDYACGSGHFLTELAAQIEPFVKEYKQADIKDFYKMIFGIEKEYRLSKVAKLSSFMYGHDGINIFHSDALDMQEKLKEGTFDILVANPPFAVEGFLETLPEEQRANYTLTETVTDVSNNRNIQCFFIERAKQLLAPNGVAGIIVPTSVLSNSDSTHNVTREIMVKYFDIISLVELGSGTFGKTGTNTVVLFLRRKAQLPEPAVHFRNRVDDWFDGVDNHDEMGVYQDLNFIKKYCEHVEIQFEHYKTLLDGKITDELLKYDIFKEYKAEFESSTEVRNLKTKKFYKDMSPQKQKSELDKRYLEFLRDKEKDKLYYFTLAFTNPQKVLVVKSPSGNAEQKQYLGYEWSAAKGGEGIKYIGGDTADKIKTPLFDPQNRNNNEKINYLVQQLYLGANIDISTLNELDGLVNLVPLVDLLDFGRKDFNKAFSLSPKTINQENKTNGIRVFSDNFTSKYQNKKLVEISIINPSKSEIKEFDENMLVSFIDMASVSEKGYIQHKEDRDFKSLKKGSYTYFRDNDIIIAKITPCMENGKCALASNLTNGIALGSSEFHVIRAKDEVMSKYIYELLNQDYVRKEAEKNMTGASGHRRVPAGFYEKLQIPLPPLDVQAQIVEECEKIDKEVEAAEKKIENSKEEIYNKTTQVFSMGVSRKLKDLVVINHLAKDPNKEPNEEFIYVDIESVGKGTGEINYENRFLGKELPSRARRLAPKGSTLISTVRPYLKGFALVKDELPNYIYSTGFAILLSKDVKILLNEVIFYIFMYSKDLMKQMEIAMPKGSYPSINKSDIENFVINLPSIEEQERLIVDVEQLENQINQAQKVLDTFFAKKQAIIKKYL